MSINVTLQELQDAYERLTPIAPSNVDALLTTLRVNPAHGISSASIAERKSKFGENAPLGQKGKRRSHAMSNYRQQLDLYFATRPVSVVRDNGTVQSISGTELVVGDIILLEVGQDIGCDLVLLDDTTTSNGMRVFADESALTGETLDVNKNRGDWLLSGSHITEIGNKPRAVVVFVGEETFMGKLCELLISEQEDTSSSERKFMQLCNSPPFNWLISRKLDPKVVAQIGRVIVDETVLLDPALYVTAAAGFPASGYTASASNHDNIILQRVREFGKDSNSNSNDSNITTQLNALDNEAKVALKQCLTFDVREGDLVTNSVVDKALAEFGNEKLAAIGKCFDSAADVRGFGFSQGSHCVVAQVKMMTTAQKDEQEQKSTAKVRWLVRGMANRVLRHCTSIGSPAVPLKDTLRDTIINEDFQQFAKDAIAPRVFAVAYCDVEDQADFSDPTEVRNGLRPAAGFTLYGLFGVTRKLRPNARASIETLRERHGVQVVLTASSLTLADSISLAQASGVLTPADEQQQQQQQQSGAAQSKDDDDDDAEEEPPARPPQPKNDDDDDDAVASSKNQPAQQYSSASIVTGQGFLDEFGDVWSVESLLKLRLGARCTAHGVLLLVRKFSEVLGDLHDKHSKAGGGSKQHRVGTAKKPTGGAAAIKHRVAVLCQVGASVSKTPALRMSDFSATTPNCTDMCQKASSVIIQEERKHALGDFPWHD